MADPLSAMTSVRGVRPDVDHVPLSIAVEEARDSPRLVSERVDDLEAGGPHSSEGFAHVIDEDRNCWILRAGPVAIHDAQLKTTAFVSDGGDPAMIHEHHQPEGVRVLGDGLRHIMDGQVRYDSFDLHRINVARCDESGNAAVLPRTARCPDLSAGVGLYSSDNTVVGVTHNQNPPKL